jgi:hypothetical protein
MNNFAKTSMALALGGALLASSVTASSARNWRPWAAAGAGFVAGAAIAGAAANANAGYYGYGPGYYERGYPYGGYAYEPSYPVEPTPYYYNRGWGRCVQDEGYGRTSDCNSGGG